MQRGLQWSVGVQSSVSIGAVRWLCGVVVFVLVGGGLVQTRGLRS